jgi:outer membrane protein TolC
MKRILAKSAQKKTFIVLVFVFLLTPLFSISQVFATSEAAPLAQILTFKDFYQKVLEYYPKLKRQDINVSLAIARKLQAVSGFLPSVQVGASVSHGDDPVYVFGSLLRENKFISDDMAIGRLNTPSAHTSYNASVIGQVPIFDAMQTIYKVRSAKLQIDSAQYDEVFTKMEAFLVASEAYLRTIAIEKLLNTVGEVSKASEEDVKQAEDLKDKGLILGADFYTAKVALGNINQLKNQFVQEKQAAHILLNILMGDDPFQTFEIEGNLEKMSWDNKSLKYWFEAAYKSRPDLAALDKTIQVQGVEILKEKSTVLPRIDAFGEARDDVSNFSSDGGQNFLVGVKAKVDLFDPSYSSRVRMSKETLKKLEYDKAILKDSIVNDLTNEFAHFQIAQNNLPVIQKMLEDAKQAVDLTLPLYREGRKSIADLLAIRSSYLNTARGFYTLSTDLKASWIRLLFLSGQLDELNINDVVKKIGE